MNKFRQWYLTYSNEITWFIIGMCVTSGLESLARGQYDNAAMSFVLAGANYYLNKRI